MAAERYLIFDLDSTLVDSSALALARERREWRHCVANLDRARPYPGIPEALRSFRDTGGRIAVVTNSVSFYAKAVLERAGVNPDALVAWHDTNRHKPDPEPVLLALQMMDARPHDKVFGIGDAAHDCAAYKAAGLLALGAGWSQEADQTCGWHRMLRAPAEILML